MTADTTATSPQTGALSRTLPAGLPVDAAERARDGVAGAVAAAGELPGGLGVGLLDAARDAYTAGLHVAAGAGAAVLLVLGLVAAVVFRSVRPYAPAGGDRSAPGVAEAARD